MSSHSSSSMGAGVSYMVARVQGGCAS